MTRSSTSREHAASLPGPLPSFYERAPDMRREFEMTRDPLIRAQMEADRLTEAQRRESFMVKRDRPRPVLRPGPSLSLGPDRAAFDAAWESERKGANDQPKGTRRAAFMEKRQRQMRERERERSR